VGLSLQERLAIAWNGHPLVRLARMGPQLMFFRQVHQLLRTGTPLPVLFAELERVTLRPERRMALAKARQRLQRGAPLADALAQAGSLFDPTTVELIRAGEETGTLERTFGGRIQQLERMRELALRTLAAFAYPLYLAIAVVFIGPLLDVAPALQAGAGKGDIGSIYLAGLGRMVLVGGGILGYVFFLPFILSAFQLDASWDRLRLRLPLVGPMYRSLYTARVCSVLASALGAGLEAGRSVSLAVAATQSPSLTPRAAEVESAVRRGDELLDAVRPLGLLDETGLAAVRIGERTGELPASLERLAQDEWELATRRLRRLAFLLLVLCVGAALAVAVVKILRVLLGTVTDTYQMIEQLEHS
jgi:type II secretory pathway component PulF